MLGMPATHLDLVTIEEGMIYSGRLDAPRGANPL
jgi:hypothetical protein